MTAATDTGAESAMIAVWDPLIRIGHWVLVGGFAIAYLTEGEPEWLHSWAGYAVAATVALRVVWGFVGPERARFASFVTTPVKGLRYLRALLHGGAPRHVGHSPAGGLMTVALLAMLAATSWTGMILYAQEDNAGPLAPWYGATVEAAAPQATALRHDDDDDHHEGRGDSVEDLHAVLSNVTLALIVLHIAGVMLASRVHGENLPRAMIDGRKRP